MSDSDKFNAAAEEYFEAWAQRADYYGQYTFSDIERLVTMKRYLDGDCFLRKMVRKDEKFPFALEVIEYSRLAASGKTMGNNIFFGGAEIDPNTARIVAYHFKQFDSTDQAFHRYNKSIRVPVEQLFHISSFRRPGQILGLPLLTPVIPFAGHLGEILEAELITKKVEAFLGVFIKESDTYVRFNAAPTDESTGKKKMELTPGMVEHLLPGEEIEVVDPKRPGSNFKEFFSTVLQGIGRPLGLSLEQISGDKSEVNYSSARHSELEFRERITVVREDNQRSFLSPVWKEVIRYGTGFGGIKAPPHFSAKRGRYLKHRWIFRGFTWVDPLKESKSKKEELLMGLPPWLTRPLHEGKTGKT